MRIEIPSRDSKHVFGTLKAWMGSAHFLTRTLPRVRTEMSLQVRAYNLQRVIKILGAATPCSRSPKALHTASTDTRQSVSDLR